MTLPESSELARIGEIDPSTLPTVNPFASIARDLARVKIDPDPFSRSRVDELTSEQSSRDFFVGINGSGKLREFDFANVARDPPGGGVIDIHKPGERSEVEEPSANLIRLPTTLPGRIRTTRRKCAISEQRHNQADALNSMAIKTRILHPEL